MPAAQVSDHLRSLAQVMSSASRPNLTTSLANSPSSSGCSSGSQRHRPGLGSRSGQFPLHLSRVPPVRYQDGVVLPHQDHAGRTAEAGEVTDVREVGNKKSVASSPAQLRPQTLDAAGQFHSG